MVSSYSKRTNIICAAISLSKEQKKILFLLVLPRFMLSAKNSPCIQDICVFGNKIGSVCFVSDLLLLIPKANIAICKSWHNCGPNEV